MKTKQKIQIEGSLILIVDDTELNIQVLGNMLKDAGYSVAFALSGKDALRIVEKINPDLILLDLLMPEMDGLEVCQRLKSNPESQEIPIIFLTASDDKQNIIEAFEKGAGDYITKPFHAPELLARVKTHLKLRLQQKSLIKINEKLQESNEELDSFSYAVSHDLLNSISLIHGFIGIIKNKYSDTFDEQGDNILEMMNDSSIQMENFVKDLLRLSKVSQEDINLTSVSLSDIITDINYRLQLQSTQRNVTLKMPSSVVAKCDYKLMNIVLENLVSNAWKYSSNNEHTRIEFGFYDEDNVSLDKLEQIYSYLHFFTSPKNEKIKPQFPIYFLKDNGVGFNIDKAKDIFKPFHRLHSQTEFKGTGIGLATVQRIIKAHGGYIWCNSKANKGTTFYFTLGNQL